MMIPNLFDQVLTLVIQFIGGWVDARFPNLFRLARDIAVERIFSGGRDTISLVDGTRSPHLAR
jgi:hypothetical protein